MRKNNGVTLVALIITIIILLILAGVVIAMTIGDEGIISKSQQAVDKYDETSAKEKVSLILAEYAMERTSSTKTLEEYLNEQIAERKLDEVINNANGTITVGIDGYKFRINDKLQITIIDGLDYDTVLEKINSKEEFSKLIETKRNIDAIISDINTYKEIIINNKNAMECIGYNEYAGNKMIQNTEWREAILSSKYLDDFNKGATTVPIMTSDTSPEGEVIVSYLGDSDPAFRCFDGNDSTPAGIGRPNTLNGYIGYIFTKEVMPYYVSILNYAAYDNYLSNIKIQGLNENGTWIDLTGVTSISQSGWSYIKLNSNESYEKYTGIRVLQTTDKGSQYYADAYTLQFYCR